MQQLAGDELMMAWQSEIWKKRQWSFFLVRGLWKGQDGAGYDRPMIQTVPRSEFRDESFQTI